MISYDLIKDVFDLDSPLTLEYFELCNTSYEGKGEKHHILPRSMYKDHVKEKWNVVNLSYEVHYRVHEILPTICMHKKDLWKMNSAWWVMSHRSTTKEFVSSCEYAKLKGIMTDMPIEERQAKTLNARIAIQARLIFTKQRNSEAAKNFRYKKP